VAGQRSAAIGLAAGWHQQWPICGWPVWPVNESPLAGQLNGWLAACAAVSQLAFWLANMKENTISIGSASQ
jgi:hypothetical protein